MGCGASLNKKATDDEQLEIFTWAVKEMRTICAGEFLSTAQSINISLPNETTKKISDEVNQVEAAEAAEAAKQDTEKKGWGQQMADKAQNVFNQVKQGAEQIKQGIEKSLKESRDAAVGEVQVKLLEDSNPALLERLAQVIKQGTTSDPRDLVRGESPYGDNEYKSCKSDAIMKDLFMHKEEEFKSILKDHCNLETNKSVNAWSQLLEGVKAANEMLGRQKFTITFDIKDYIAGKTLDYMMQKMGEHEKNVRNEPAGKAKEHKQTFVLCFSGQPLMHSHVKEFKNGQ